MTSCRDNIRVHQRNPGMDLHRLRGSEGLYTARSIDGRVCMTATMIISCRIFFNLQLQYGYKRIIIMYRTNQYARAMRSHGVQRFRLLSLAADCESACSL